MGARRAWTPTVAIMSADLHDSLHEANPKEFECMVSTMRFGEEDADLELACKEETPNEYVPELSNASQSTPKATLLSNVRERIATTLTAMAALRHIFRVVPI